MRPCPQCGRPLPDERQGNVADWKWINDQARDFIDGIRNDGRIKPLYEQGLTGNDLLNNQYPRMQGTLVDPRYF